MIGGTPGKIGWGLNVKDLRDKEVSFSASVVSEL